jgi:hypothetical protein
VSEALPEYPPQAVPPTAECGSCHTPIDWAEKTPVELNDKGLPKTIPINHDSVDDPAGRIEVWRESITGEGGQPYLVLRARYLKKGESPAQGHHSGVSHFATCVQAAQWRGNQRR